MGIAIMQIFNLFMCKVTLRYPFGKMLFMNPYTVPAVVAGLAVSAFVVYPPFMHAVFQTYTLNPQFWLFPIIFGFVIVAYCTARIAYRRRLTTDNLNLSLPLDLHPTRFSTRSANKK